MEVHHHTDLHHKRKYFKEYFLEFLMIFLAVTIGFFTESIRENISNNEHAKLLTNQLVAGRLPAGLTKPCTITTLTTKTFIFTTTDTSSNGGTYYRRVWLKK